MIISLLGYMGSGKSHVSKNLSKKLNFPLIDLDQKISEEHQLSIPEIFQNKGEIFFRKEEKRILKSILNERSNVILSLGGGTPVYYNNMDLINQFSKSIFLRASVKTLTERIMLQKNSRPLIARLEDNDIPEFIAKHLFERNPFYGKSHFTIDTDSKTASEISDEIIRLLKI
ncbi:shikimate kinase [Epilithonimonas pallida]|uniref:Shikimate kinase n=1 Tax=Epilithonimonas pallida TaxID=373671 RepID=A0ABY1R1C2_9FLAO|nr:shikimate kinase [Epilithonimonas pallida]SMP92035.1 shikimate kinase [Epilithonimonas pallida]